MYRKALPLILALATAPAWGQWVEEQILIPDDPDGTNHSFGDSVGISGDIAVGGARLDSAFGLGRDPRIYSAASTESGPRRRS
jgi:hypothetical protein